MMNNFEKMHQKTKDMRYEGTDYNGKPIIIDACELRPDVFEVSVIAKRTSSELETVTVRSLKSAKEEYDRMLLFHTTGTASGMYSQTDWERDGSFRAKVGQEISPAIYESMRDTVPPLSLPASRRRNCDRGFLMGEPHDTDPVTGKMRYLAFVTRFSHFYYAGLSSK